MQISLENQVAVITGGSRGIGAATVKLFAQAGARVVFSYRKAARAARQVTSTIPLGRLAQPEEIAMPILFLASSMSTFMTGEIVNVNGGSVLCG